jgi:hypothetical protein
LNWRIKKWCNTRRIMILARSFYFYPYFCIMRHSGEWAGCDIWVLLPFTTERGSVFGVSILLQAGRAGIRKPVWAGGFITSKHVQIGPRVYLDYSGWRSFSQWQIGRSIALTTHFHVPPRLGRIELHIAPPRAFMAERTHFYFSLKFVL